MHRLEAAKQQGSEINAAWVESTKVEIEEALQRSNISPLDRWRFENLLFNTVIKSNVAQLIKPLVPIVGANCEDAEGNTALVVAIREGQVECVKELLKAGADVNKYVGSVDCAPAVVAVSLKDFNSLELLLKTGNVDLRSKFTACVKAIEAGDEKCSSLFFLAEDVGERFLMLISSYLPTVIEKKMPEVLKGMLSKGINASVGVEPHKKLSLSLIKYAREKESTECLEVLMQHQAAVEADELHTARLNLLENLRTAVKNDSPEEMQACIDAIGTDDALYHQDSKGEVVFQSAARLGSVKCVKALSNTEEVYMMINNPFLIAIENGHKDPGLLEMLYDGVRTREFCIIEALRAVISHDMPEVLDMILSKKGGEIAGTALEAVVKLKQDEILSFLLRSGKVSQEEKEQALLKVSEVPPEEVLQPLKYSLEDIILGSKGDGHEGNRPLLKNPRNEGAEESASKRLKGDEESAAEEGSAMNDVTQSVEGIVLVGKEEELAKIGETQDLNGESDA